MYHMNTTAGNKDALDIQSKECSSIINESKDRHISRMSAKLDNAKNVSKTYWSSIKKTPIKNGSKLPNFSFKTEKRLTLFDIKNDDILLIIKSPNMDKAHRMGSINNKND